MMFISRERGAWAWPSARREPFASSRRPGEALFGINLEMQHRALREVASATASHHRLEGLERFAGRGQALHLRLELARPRFRARATAQRLLKACLQLGDLRLGFFQQPRLVFEPAQSGDLLEHLV